MPPPPPQFIYRCIIEGGLLTQVETHAVETLGAINLAVLRVAC